MDGDDLARTKQVVLCRAGAHRPYTGPKYETGVVNIPLDHPVPLIRYRSPSLPFLCPAESGSRTSIAPWHTRFQRPLSTHLFLISPYTSPMSRSPF
jgi:hypothetical protein